MAQFRPNSNDSTSAAKAPATDKKLSRNLFME
jgi:hypothetical protein